MRAPLLDDGLFGSADCNRAAALRVPEAFRSAGIKRHGFLLLGGPGETKETVEESLEFADRLHLDALKITVGLRIYPQTPLASTAIAHGLIAADDNLLVPRFYVTPSLREWLPERIARVESAHASRAT
jgi:radical SAM superfamily enzyme YgiQ (UPF0313 family)